MDMTRELYELLRDLTYLADKGREKMEADADSADSRKEVAKAAACVLMGSFYVEEYEEQYRFDSLPH